MKSYVFGLSTSGDGIDEPLEFIVDTFSELEGRYDFDYYIDPNNEFHPCELDPETYQRDRKTLNGMTMRAKMATGDNPHTCNLYHVKVEDDADLDRDTLQALLDGKKREGKLKEFLDNSKMKV